MCFNKYEKKKKKIMIIELCNIYRGVLKCDVTKTREIMGLHKIFSKSMMKNAHLPKISVLLQLGGEILALLCSVDSIQTLLILPQFLTLGTEDKKKGFVLSHQSIKVSIFHPQNVLGC